MVYVVTPTGEYVNYVGIVCSVDSETVIRVQADGDELEHILSKCPSLPVVRGERCISWYGDTAKFITENIIKRW